MGIHWRSSGRWLGLCTLTAKGPGSVPGRGTKIPQAAWPSQKNNNNKGGHEGGRNFYVESDISGCFSEKYYSESRPVGPGPRPAYLVIHQRKEKEKRKGRREGKYLIWFLILKIEIDTCSRTFIEFLLVIWVVGYLSPPYSVPGTG